MNSESTSARAAYDVWHARYGVDVEATTPWHLMVRRHLAAFGDLGCGRLLEIGCGRGGFACWLARQNPRPTEITAVDFSSTAVELGHRFATEAGLAGMCWKTGDIQNIAEPEGSFDTVVSCETIEHVPAPSRAIRELARVLKPGGRLFLTCPNYLGPMGLYRVYLRARGRRYTEEGQPINQPLLLPVVRSWVRRAGLKICLIDAVGHYLPFPGRPPIELPGLNLARPALKWFGLHSCVVAAKPLAPAPSAAQPDPNGQG